MKITLYLKTIALLLFPLYYHAQGSLYTIDRGKIKGDFELKLIEQNINLSHTDFFSLKALNILANKPSPKDLSSSGYKRKDLITYEIEIERNSDHKKYYGRIAFYSMFNRSNVTNQAVASYYNIEIGANYFSQTSDGVTTCIYEYYTKRQGDPVKYPTWVIWFSDVPLMEVAKHNPKDDVMYKNRSNLSVGMGFVNLTANKMSQPISNGLNGTNNTADFVNSGPFFVKYEYAVKPKFTIGLNFSKHTMSANYFYSYSYDSAFVTKTATETLDYTAYSLSLKTNWHFAIGRHFQMFFGPGIGINSKKAISNSTAVFSDGTYLFYRPARSITSSSLRELTQRNIMLDLSLGARFYITKNIGVFIEAATVKAAFQTGLVLGI